MDLGEGIYAALNSVAQGILQRKQASYLQDLMDARHRVLGEQVAPLFSQLQPQYSQPETGRLVIPGTPDNASFTPAPPMDTKYPGGMGFSTQAIGQLQPRESGILGATQPTIPQSLLGYQNVPVTPSLSDPRLMMALSAYQELGGDTAPILNAIKAAQPTYSTLAPGAALIKQQNGKAEPVYINPNLNKRTANSWTVVNDASGNPIKRQEGQTVLYKVQEVDPSGKPTGNIDWKPKGNIARPAQGAVPEVVVKSMLEKFNADANVRKYDGVIGASRNIIDLLDAHNPVADNSIPTYMARASGEVGNLSEADKAPFGGSLSIKQRIDRTVQKAKDGKLDDTDRDFVRTLAQVMEKSGIRNKDRLARLRAAQYSKVIKGSNEQDLYQILSPTGGIVQDDNTGPVKISSDEEYDKLPSGAHFIDPNGTERVKP